MHIIREAVYRNFGGLRKDQLDVQLIMDNIFRQQSPEAKKDAQRLDSKLGLHWIKENIAESRSFKGNVNANDLSRRIMFLTDEVNSGWQILFESGILDIEKTEVIFGSHFRQDKNSSTNLCHSINRIKNCMETGNIVVLLHVDDLHDSLYVLDS